MKNSVTSILCFFLALQPCDINTYICQARKCGYNTRNLADVVMTTFVVIFHLFVVMITPCFFLYYILVQYRNTLFRSGSSKKAIFLNYDHFLPTMWTPNRGHWHKKCGHKYTMVLLGTIDLWYIYKEKYIFYGRKLKKDRIFLF